MICTRYKLTQSGAGLGISINRKQWRNKLTEKHNLLEAVNNPLLVSSSFISKCKWWILFLLEDYFILHFNFKLNLRETLHYSLFTLRNNPNWQIQLKLIALTTHANTYTHPRFTRVNFTWCTVFWNRGCTRNHCANKLHTRRFMSHARDLSPSRAIFPREVLRLCLNARSRSHR